MNASRGSDTETVYNVAYILFNLAVFLFFSIYFLISDIRKKREEVKALILQLRSENGREREFAARELINTYVADDFLSKEIIEALAQCREQSWHQEACDMISTSLLKKLKKHIK